MPDVLSFHGEPPTTSDAERWAEALAFVRQYRGRALAIADDRIADLAVDAAGRAQWRSLRSLIIQIKDRAVVDAEQH